MPKNRNKAHRNYIYEKYKFKCNLCGLSFNIPPNWDKKSAIHDNGMF